MTARWRSDAADRVLRDARGSSDYQRIECPACADRHGTPDRKHSCSVHLTRGWIRCWRCGWRSRLPGDEWSNADDAPDWEQADHEPPSSFVPLAGPTRVAQPGRDYLLGRRVGPDVWAAAGIGYATEGREEGCVIVPCLDLDGVEVGWVARAVQPRHGPEKYTAPGMPRARHLLNERALLGDVVLVVEGPMDALAHWPRAAALLGKETRDQVERIAAVVAPAAHLVIALDGDSRDDCQALGYTFELRRPHGLTTALRLPPREDPASVPDLVRAGVALAAERRATLVDLE